MKNVWDHLANCFPCLRASGRSDDQLLSSNNTAMNCISESHPSGTLLSSDQNQFSIVSASECCHPGLGETVGQYQHCSDTIVNNHVFALIIGINKYQDAKIRNLKGCIKDSENVCRFLTESLHANPLHIKHLRDAEATRKEILSTFEEHFINNQDIHPNDTIVFYFAGHGSYETPAENSLARNNMETICPYDDRAEERGIPDRTFASLMRRLASIKGNNITAIFDSCHSGGMGRGLDLENSRFLAPPDSPFPKGLDEDIWNLDSPRSPTEIQDDHLPYFPLTSHILFAACQRDELAYEIPLSTGGHHSGAFTSLLLDLLRQPGRNLTETTYIGLFHTLERPENKSRLPKQTPYVEGNNKTRILFSMTDLGRQFPVVLSKNETFSVPAGTIHGVDEETEFTITSGKDCFEGLKPFHVSPLSSIFNKLDNMSLKDDSRADITKWNQFHPKVFIHQSSDGPSDSLDYDVVISRSPDGRMKLERKDELIPHYAESDIQFTPQDGSLELSTPDSHLSTIIDAATRFNFHLLLQSRSNRIGDKLQVKLERLSTLGELGHDTEIIFFPAENGEDFFTSSEPLRPKVNIKKGPKVTAAVKLTDLNPLFGFTLSIHNYQTPLFPYVFAFDAATYEVASFYHPEHTKEGPLRANKVVTVGYGSEGGYPIKFQPNEVTFFKIFVTSKYVDLKGLVQESPFPEDADRMPKRPPLIPKDFWESWIYIVRS
ncbi:hypothetical protein BYT27DRAFT_7158296 [Phlegmacium glaucopus]|nr:hypothetical protein BYT27DRAFT_7158296 [Phlegmacium glaucopus]